MKKTKSHRKRELRPEYKPSDFPAGFVRGKYATRLASSSNIVVLDPKIAAAFPTSAAVNKALGGLLRIARTARPSTRSNGRRSP